MGVGIARMEGMLALHIMHTVDILKAGMAMQLMESMSVARRARTRAVATFTACVGRPSIENRFAGVHHQCSDSTGREHQRGHGHANH